MLDMELEEKAFKNVIKDSNLSETTGASPEQLIEMMKNDPKFNKK